MGEYESDLNMAEEFARSIAPEAFALYRTRDISGVSGLGIIANGVEFPDGTVAVRWNGTYSSTVIWASMEDLISIHGHGGTTSVVWWGPLNPLVILSGRERDAAWELTDKILEICDEFEASSDVNKALISRIREAFEEE